MMREINASLPFDKRMWRQDVAGSGAPAGMLGAEGLIPAADAAGRRQGLGQVTADYEGEGVREDLGLEDSDRRTGARLAE